VTAKLSLDEAALKVLDLQYWPVPTRALMQKDHEAWKKEREDLALALEWRQVLRRAADRGDITAERQNNGPEQRYAFDAGALIDWMFANTEQWKPSAQLLAMAGRQAEARQGRGSPRAYTTRLLELLDLAVQEFASQYMAGPRPKSDTVIAWLVERGATRHEAAAIDLICRPDELKAGGSLKRRAHKDES
jgi:hypothetical protein